MFVSVLTLGMFGMLIAADMLFGGASWWPFSHRKYPTTVTHSKLNSLSFELHLLLKEKGRYPSDIEEWNDWLGLSVDDGKRRRWYLDGWGQSIKYVPTAPRLNVGAFDLYSVGPNGADEYDKANFGDDIHVHWPSMYIGPHRQSKKSSE